MVATATATAARDWSDLPSEIMDLIAKNIDRYGDFIAFGSVCKSFQLATSYVEHPKNPSNYPLLMLSDGTNYHDGQVEGEKLVETRSFYNIFTTKVFDINLPEAFGKRCLAVNFGWLLTLSLDQEIKLLHPFSKRQIDLPNCRTLMPYSDMPVPDERFFRQLPFFIERAVISSSPDDSNNNCIVFAVFADWKKLAFTRIGEDRWTVIETYSQGFRDIIYHKGLLFAVNALGFVYSCNIDDERPKLVAIATIQPMGFNTHHYLVELDGNLLVVARIYSGLYYSDDQVECEEDLEDETKSYYTSKFIIYKMKNHGFKGYKYPYQQVKIGGLGNRALFLGYNSSVCIPCSTNNLIKAGCIYFTDDNYDMFNKIGGGYDMGIYHNKTIQRHYSGPSRSIHSPPLWLI